MRCGSQLLQVCFHQASHEAPAEAEAEPTEDAPSQQPSRPRRASRIGTKVLQSRLSIASKASARSDESDSGEASDSPGSSPQMPTHEDKSSGNSEHSEQRAMGKQRSWNKRVSFAVTEPEHEDGASSSEGSDADDPITLMVPM